MSDRSFLAAPFVLAGGDVLEGSLGSIGDGFVQPSVPLHLSESGLAMTTSSHKSHGSHGSHQSHASHHSSHR
jgi:hypothetical protein